LPHLVVNMAAWPPRRRCQRAGRLIRGRGVNRLHCAVSRPSVRRSVALRRWTTLHAPTHRLVDRQHRKTIFRVNIVITAAAMPYAALKTGTIRQLHRFIGLTEIPGPHFLPRTVIFFFYATVIMTADVRTAVAPSVWHTRALWLSKRLNMPSNFVRRPVDPSS